MNYKIETTSVFVRQAKRLGKKYSSLRNELTLLCEQLSVHPFLGESLGHNTYKIRLGVESKGKGKRGGLRIITYCVHANRILYLLSIYDKSEIGAIEQSAIKKIIDQIIDS